MLTRTILVVDDEPDMQLLVRQKFRKHISSGIYNFHFAGNGQEALEKISENPDIEIVMTDINMPVMTGLEFLEKVNGSPNDFKCIVASAYNDIDNIRTAMTRGAFDFITKPIDFGDLEATIEKTLKAVEERKLSKQALVERDQAKASEKFKQQFLANMSHEIRTPMNSVIGITHLLLKSELTEQQHRYVSMIQAASEQLMSIINDILDISKIEAGKMVFEQIPFSPSTIATNVKNILSMKAEEKQLDLRVTVDKGVPDQVIGDPSRLAQIITNLAGNAIKFTDKGSVEINISNKSESTDYVNIGFSIIDTGIGIPADKLDSIFESFTQAENDTSRKYGGTGLGLSISRQLVEIQNGKIGLESEYGKGTRFFFSIPFLPSSEVSSGASPEGTDDISNIRQTLKNARLLLVEDNEFNKIVAEDTIRDFQSDIFMDHASNGLEALNMVISNTYDLVLMDIQMPEMDGYEATVKIRLLESDKRHSPIMAMTANATPEEIKKCFESGMDEYISKPFIPEDLFKKMAALISREKTVK
jgi:signal transduction histidine kinase